MDELPLGPEVDAWPRPLPARVPLAGAHVGLEPLHRRHAAELFEAMRGDEDSFIYMSYGPFASAEALRDFVAAQAARHDPMVWAVRPVVTGRVSGWLALLNIDPQNAAIELGSIWFGPALRRTRAATEAMFLLLTQAADGLGYERLVWNCNALNAPSIRAALRLGFSPEGVARAHMKVKGRRRDTAMFSITAAAWPARRDAITRWLAPENFAADGTALRGLAELRDDPPDAQSGSSV